MFDFTSSDEADEAAGEHDELMRQRCDRGDASFYTVPRQFDWAEQRCVEALAEPGAQTWRRWLELGTELMILSSGSVGSPVGGFLVELGNDVRVELLIRTAGRNGHHHQWR